MWWSDIRPRAALAAAAVVLAGCGFTPVYAPGGAGLDLAGLVTVPAPKDRQQQLYHDRLRERLGRGAAQRYRLDNDISVSPQGLGTTLDGRTTLYQLVGQVAFDLVALEDGAKVISATTEAFTSYSASGSTVATAAAQRDATERLMVILADQTIDALLLQWPEDAAQTASEPRP